MLIYLFIIQVKATLVDIATWWLKISMTITPVCSDAVQVG